MIVVKLVNFWCRTLLIQNSLLNEFVHQFYETISKAVGFLFWIARTFELTFLLVSNMLALKVWLKMCLYVLYKTCAEVNIDPMGQTLKKKSLHQQKTSF